MEGTVKWRLSFWRELCTDVFSDSRLFWFGAGFGPNVAGEKCYNSSDIDRPNKHPHNFHVNILYRMGVAGFSIWIFMLVLFAFSVIRGIMKTSAAGDKLLFSVLVWIFCFWVMALVNASFDVYLEGPMGGILFWCVMGLGLAVLRVQRTGEKGI